MIDGFRSAWWLSSPHFQTVWGRLARPRQAIPFVRESIETPDGDELFLDHVESPGAPLRVVLLHGLEGSSNSVYMQGLATLACRRGWSVTALNFRSCARDPRDLSRMLQNRRPRFYHSGETSDLDFVVRTLAGRDPSTPLAAIGTSLGGNVVLKWLGENPEPGPVKAAVALSVPYDLAAGAAWLERGLGPIYVRAFVRTLAAKAERLANDFPDLGKRLDLEAIRRSRTFREFDRFATAPIHGFVDEADYWRKSSSIGFVGRITVPTLCISSEDDPFLPPDALPNVQKEKSGAVELAVTKKGGHIGFVTGSFARPRYWAEETAIDWVARSLSAQA